MTTQNGWVAIQEGPSEEAVRLRLLLIEAQQALEAGHLNGELERLSSEIGDYKKLLSQGAPRKIRSLEEVLAEAREMSKRPKVSSVIPGLDEKLKGGFGAGHMITIGAFTSGGKTTTLVAQASHSSKLGHPTLFYTVECGASEVGEKLELCLGEHLESQWRKINVEDEHSDLEGVISDIEAWHAHEGVKDSEKIPVVMLDYAQRVRNGSDGNRERQVGGVAEAMQELARRLKFTLFIAAQLNRESSKDGREPTISDFRESGLLEQTADVALLCWRPKETEDRLTVKLAKNRWGGNVDHKIEMSVDFGQSWLGPLTKQQKYADLHETVMEVLRETGKGRISVRDLCQKIKWGSSHPKKVDLLSCSSAIGGFSVVGSEIILIESDTLNDVAATSGNTRQHVAEDHVAHVAPPKGGTGNKPKRANRQQQVGNLENLT